MYALTPTILAIDPGSKEIGFAIFSGATLRHFGVKTITPRTAPHLILLSIARVTEALIQAHRPAVLAIEHTPRRPSNTVLLNVAAVEIKAIAEQYQMQLYEYWPLEVRQFLCQTTKSSKRATAQGVVTRYPELRRYLQRSTKWEQLYWAKMFDAVAIGIYCWEEIRQTSATTQSTE